MTTLRTFSMSANCVGNSANTLHGGKVDRSELIIKPYQVTVEGHPSYVYYAKSRGRALSQAWQSYRSYREDLCFGRFLRIAQAQLDPEPHERFGEPILVSGKPAFLVSLDSQYIQFVRPGSDEIFNTHPLDVEPKDARRGTPYYRQETR